MHNTISRMSRTLLAAAALAASVPAFAATYTVTNTNDDTGPGTLRSAILGADADPGNPTITFHITTGASLIKTISITSQLPALTKPTTIDGSTQDSFSGTPLIQIDGTGAGVSGVTGLQIAAGPSTVQSLMITGFSGNGLYLTGGSGVSVKGCYLGYDGSKAVGNSYAGLAIDGTTFSNIGDVGTSGMNVISGNGQNGVFVGSGSHDIGFYHNWIGINAAGTAAVPNSGAGLRLIGANTRIGNALASQRNVISGNSYGGISIDPLVAGTQIIGAYIGLNAVGTAAIGNGGDGVADAGIGSQIGDVTPGGGNVISGNAGNGVSFSGSVLGSQVVNNLIGTDPSGATAIGNQAYGIRALSGGSVDIGISGTNGGNVISGNANNGVVIEGPTDGYSIDNNLIGTNAAGGAALANTGDGIVIGGQNVTVGTSAKNIVSGNTGNGISIFGAQDVTIDRNVIGLDAAGATKIANAEYGIRALTGTGVKIGQPGAGNVISGNARGMILEQVGGATVQGNVIGLSSDQSTAIGNGEVGLQIDTANNQIGGLGGAANLISGNTAAEALFLYGPGATGNHVEGNVIGTDAALVKNFGNNFGIVIYGGSGNYIGGTSPGTGNVIAYSNNFGIYDWLGSQNRFLGNSIHDIQHGLGIDLQPQGPLPNDPLDEDHGANEGQNYPIVTQATAGATNVTIAGKLNSEPSTSFRVEYFVSIVCDPSGMGEGQYYIGSEDTSTDVNGNATLGATLFTVFTEGYVTATATSASGNTSEFSPCVAIGAPIAGEFNIAQNPVLAYEDLQIAHVAVVRSQGVASAVSVRVKTSDGTATAPADYGAIDQILNFADGEAVKEVDIPIVLHTVPPDPDKQFGLALSQATGGAFLGPQASVTVDLFHHDPAYPFYLAGDATVPEPLSGQLQVNVPVRLSAATNHPITLVYSTQDGSAKAGQDYVAASGQVMFAAGATINYVPITVTANGVQPFERVFNLLISAISQQVIAGDGEGEIVILANDELFKNGFN